MTTRRNGDETEMDCPRCKAPMVVDVFEDMDDDTGILRFKAWRCLVCGEVLDPIILRHRVHRPPPVLGHARRR